MAKIENKVDYSEPIMVEGEDPNNTTNRVEDFLRQLSVINQIKLLKVAEAIKAQEDEWVTQGVRLYRRWKQTKNGETSR